MMTDQDQLPSPRVAPLPLGAFTAVDFTATIAAELAAQIHEPAAIFEKFGLNEEESKALLTTPRFQALVKQAHAEWRALDNTEKRVRYKALIAVEELMPTLFSLVADKDNPAASRNETFKSFMKLAALDRTDIEAQKGQQFSITINLPKAPPTQISGTTILESEENEE